MAKEKLAFDIRKVGVSRALYMGKDEFAKMAFTLHDLKGREITFELDVIQARELIEQMANTYHAIIPPLRVNRNHFGH